MGADADLVRRLTDEVFIRGNLAAVDDLVAEDFESHDPPPGFAGTKDGFRQFTEMILAAFSDRKMDFDDLADTTDGRVVDNWAMIATHSGDAFGVPATGEIMRIRGMELYRCADGKIAEHWAAVDMSDFFEKVQAASG
jgi:steroid delta-isomerase-like uncharacterized protein